MPTIFDNLRAAWQSLREQWQRSLLSMIGVMVGSLAIVLLVSIAKGVQQDIGQQVNGLGVNLLIVIPGRINDGSMFSPNLAGLSYLEDGDIGRVLKVPGVKRAAPLMFVGGGIKAGKKLSPSTFIIAAGSEWFNIHHDRLAGGRFFSPADSLKKVCVIGSIAQKSLFGTQSALGKSVEINDSFYQVVGVTQDPESESSMFSMGGFQNMCYLPYELMKKTVPNPQLHRIMVQTAPEVEPKSLVKNVESVLAERLPREAFSVLTQEDLLKLIYKVMGILTTLLTGLTSIALFVGGVGIMTIMLMSVNERSREIGVRKTVGARNSDVFAQFLAEALMISFAGGLVGLGLSWGICVALAKLTVVKPLITPGIILLALGVSLGVGAAFGIIPALRAARKDPVASLRAE